MWRDVKHPTTGRLLFRYDPERELIQIQDRGQKTIVDLQEFRHAVAQMVTTVVGALEQIVHKDSA